MLRDFLQDGQQVFEHAYLLVVDEDKGVFKLGDHLVRIGDEIGGKVAAVKLHAFHFLQAGVDGFGFFDVDDAFFAHGFHGLGDQPSDLVVVVGGDGSDLGDLFVALDGLGKFVDFIHHDLGGLFQAAFQIHGVHPGGHVLEAFLDDGLGQQGGGGGAVSGNVVGLFRNFFAELRAHVFKFPFQFDLFGDGHAVVGDGRRTKLLVQYHVSAAGPEGHLHGIGKLINALLECGAGFV